MSDRLINGSRWPWARDIVFMLVDDGKFPFPIELAIAQIKHQADLLQYLTGKRAMYGGTVNSVEGYQSADQVYNKDYGWLYVRYVDQSELIPGNAAGHSGFHDENGDRCGGFLTFGDVACKDVATFAGILTHEFGHSLGLNHWNGGRSVMNDAPYNGATYSSMWMLEDLKSFYKLFPGPMPKTYALCYDRGDLRKGECVIYVPRIKWAPGRWASVYLYGSQYSDGEWILETKSGEIYDVAPGLTECFLADDILHLPTRYMGASILIKAKLQAYQQFSGKAQFEVLSIEPRFDS